MRRTLQTTSELFTGATAVGDKLGDLFSFNKGSREQVRHQCFWARGELMGLPNAVIPTNYDLESFFADIATYYPAFAPVSAYAHVLTADVAPALELTDQSEMLSPNLDEHSVKSTIGLAIGETLTAGANLTVQQEAITYAACRRTLAFSLARAAGLYPGYAPKAVAEKWLRTREIARMETPVQLAAAILWISSLQHHQSENIPESMSTSMLQGQLARVLRGKTRQEVLIDEFALLLPAIRTHAAQMSGAFDGRINAFTRIADIVATSDLSAEIGATYLGYFCNQLLPGSLTHFKVLTPYLSRYPSALVWYGLFAGLSSQFDWRGIYSGLGLKLARDLTAQFSFSDRPTSDISFEELEVLSRLPLRNSILKPTQQRACAVALMPGLDVYVRMSMADEQGGGAVADASDRQQQTRREQRLIALLQEALSVVSPPQTTQSASPKRAKKLRGD